MKTPELVELLKNTTHITQSQTNDLAKIVKEFPYFQSARALYLEGIKQFNPSLYNATLKTTVAYTSDTIASSTFTHNKEASNSTQEHRAAANHSSKTNDINKWLNLNNRSPIVRDNKQTAVVTPTPISKTDYKLKREEKFRLIDEFIKKNPKLKPLRKDTPQRNIANDRGIESNVFMTETLAQIYVKQENYTKALQAYNTLSLKFPEKSSFFADRILAIKKLQANKEKNIS